MKKHEKKKHKKEEEVIEKIEEEKKEEKQLFKPEHQEKLECPFCMKKYKSQTWLDKHIAEKHAHEQFTEPEVRHEKHEKNKKMNPHDRTKKY